MLQEDLLAEFASTSFEDTNNIEPSISKVGSTCILNAKCTQAILDRMQVILNLSITRGATPTQKGLRRLGDGLTGKREPGKR